ncbi:hypothetical protein [Paraburkholderia acidisoli]|uniref:hypothetical protein n=1 Tax=Paraburkholderia acidisoli TaxID=2571748 RepID=UPI001E63EF36|nr:hypothetical protein [Paraburkholderia acidisoli]
MNLPLRLRIVVQRFWQPTCACMTCMLGSWANVMSAAHWIIAIRTGLFTSVLALLLTFTPAARLFRERTGNALMVGVLTCLGDFISHRSGYAHPVVEHVLTGVTSGVFAWIAWYLLEDRARRLRAVWTALRMPGRNRP